MNLRRRRAGFSSTNSRRAFSVTPQTIRKDLNDLCDGRVLTRIHGGAIFPRGNENVKYEARRSIAALEKQAIGQAAAAMIPNNSSLFINIGTTTEAVGEALLDHTELMVITNNIINVANRLRVYPSIEVVIAGAWCAVPMAVSSVRQPSISFASSRWITRLSVRPRSITMVRFWISIIAK